MTAIPEDVRERAREALDEVASDYTRFPEDIIAALIRSEREAARAEVLDFINAARDEAETILKGVVAGGGDSKILRGGVAALQDIAAAILQEPKE